MHIERIGWLLLLMASAHLVRPPPAGADLVPVGEAAARRLVGPGAPSRAAIAEAIAADGVYHRAPVGAGACARCHPDVVRHWSASAHRFASFSNPYYAASARLVPREIGPDAFVFCANCHDPALIASDGLDDVDELDPTAHAGIGCLLCHSVGEPPPPIGNGRYVARLDPIKLGAEHSARMRPAGVDDGRLCGSCHRAGIPEHVSGARFYRAQDDFFAWYDSPYAGRGVDAVFTAEPQGCVGCHMPRVDASPAEKGAKDGMIRDHRVLAAGTALAHVRGDAAHVEATAERLRGAVRIALAASEPGWADVVMVNDRVGHGFPGGVNDANLAWLTWRISDRAGRLLVERGAPGDDGQLPADTHLIRSQAVDAHGAPLKRRAGWEQRAVAFDTRLPPLAPRMVRVALPAQAAVVEVRLLYRQFDADFVQFACAALADGPARSRCLDPPTTEVARVTARVDAMSTPTDWRTITEHGLALAEGELEDLRAAERVLEQALSKAPNRAEPLLAMARVAHRLGRPGAALAWLGRVDALPDAPPARHALRARIALDTRRPILARAPVEALLAAHPDDRQALTLAAIVRRFTGDHPGQLAAAEALLKVDPEHPEGLRMQADALHRLGRLAEASLAWARWDRLRVDRAADERLGEAFELSFPARQQAVEEIPRWR